MGGAAGASEGEEFPVNSRLPLAGLRVVELATGIPGGYCTRLLRDAGAEVWKLEPPGGDPLRRWASRDEPLATGEYGPLFGFLAGGKQSTVADLATAEGRRRAIELATEADLLVDGFEPEDLAKLGLAADAFRAANPRLVEVSITAWGGTGPFAGRAATEFTLQAGAGGMAARGLPERAPMWTGGRIGEWFGGAIAANAALAAWRRARHAGVGEHVDVSLFESLHLLQNAYTLTGASMIGGPVFHRRVPLVPGIEPTKDGWVGFITFTGQQWLDFCVLVEHPEWHEDTSLLIATTRMERRAELLPVIQRWTRERTTDEVIEAATALRIPVAPIGNGKTLPAMDHLVERGWYLRDEKGTVQPAPPYEIAGVAHTRPEAPPALGEGTPVWGERASPRRPRAASARLPFEGLRVADFTMFWAGPIVSHFLAALGAEVIHVESIQRPDGIRMFSLRPLTEPDWWEWSFIYQGTNTNKRGLTLDLSRDEGRALARRLARECDVVIENFSPRVVEQLGLEYASLAAENPELVMVRMPAFGISGPWRDRVGFAQTIEQVSGMAWLTGYADTSPWIPNGPCDPIAGTQATLALLVALEERDRTGRGQLVEAPMLGGAINMTAEQVLAYSTDHRLLERRGNRAPGACPQGVFRCRGEERWLALSIATDSQWRALCDVLGREAWKEAPTFASLGARRDREEFIEGEIGRWCASRTVEDALEALTSRGVPASRVCHGYEVAEHPQLVARGFIEELDHPKLGRRPYAAHPARFARGPEKWNRRHAPLLGEHNREILAGLLGLTEEQIRALEERRIIGDAPATAQTRF